MRTIKFRAWDSLHKVYRDHQDPQTIQAVIFGNDYDGRVIVEQFTGLLDKNGKEIYEGDILNWYTTKGTTNGLNMTVTYFDDRAMWGIVFGNGFDTFEAYMEFGDVGKQFEVIGNIHEGHQ